MALRAASVFNHILSGSEQRFNFQTMYVRFPILIGSGDLSSITLSDIGWIRSTGGTSDITNAFVVAEAALESGSNYVPLTKGGLSTWTVLPGDNDTQYDAVPASALSLSSFARGTTLWFRARYTLALAGDVLPFGNGRHTSTVAGTQCWWVNPAVTTVSAVYGTGVFTSSGTAPDARLNGYCPIVLGTYVTGDPATWFFAGDSIEQGQGDSTSTAGGFGIAQRSAYDTGASNRLLSNINFTRIGGATSGFTGATNDRCAYWSKYCRYALDEHGTNDFGTSGTGLTAAAMVTNRTSLATKFKGTYGVSKVVSTTLGPRTTSTDSFVTEENQTITGAGWGSGQNVQQFNTLIAAQVGSGVDAVCTLTSWFGTDPTKWIVTGAASYATADGTHPSAVMHGLLASQQRATMDAVAAADVTPPSTTKVNTWIGIGIGI